MKGEEAFQKPKHLLEWARMPSIFFFSPFFSNDTWLIPTTNHEKSMEVKHSVWFVTQRNVLRARHSPIKLPKEKGWVAELAALPISLRGTQSASFPSSINMIAQNLNNIG